MKQKEELLEEKIMGPKSQISIDEKDYEGDMSPLNNEEDLIKIIMKNIMSEVDDIHIAEKFKE
ncbi:hypothetical protein A0H81_06748 [Grifola frondosa]|uniref:Uncharacterized protein n=1 Tax=Grifola frondosa TaxID=5627 RepID=A0A1C7M8Y3_GRIFR|nr:hypothetical protein A0H81_06748 [Grifola frondosa]